MSENNVFVCGMDNRKAFEPFHKNHVIIDYDEFSCHLKKYKDKHLLFIQDDLLSKRFDSYVLNDLEKKKVKASILIHPSYRVGYTNVNNIRQRFLAASKLDVIHTFSNELFVNNLQFYIKDACVHKEHHALSNEEFHVFTTILYLLGENINTLAAKYDVEPGIIELFGFVPAFLSKNPDVLKLRSYFPEEKYTIFYNSQRHILYIDRTTSDGKVIPNEIAPDDIKDEIITQLSDHIRNFGLSVIDLYFSKKPVSETSSPHALSLWNCYNLFKMLEKQHHVTCEKLNGFSSMTEEELEFYCFHKENRWVIPGSQQKELEKIVTYRENEALFRNDKLKSMYA